MGSIFDYLCFDSYKFEAFIDHFKEEKSLITILLNILEGYAVFEDGKSKLCVNFARTLFNLMISPCNHFKLQLIEEGGIERLKGILHTSYTRKDFEIYFYTLGLIPAILQTYP